jgi:carboxypeptidase Taq
MTASSQKTFDQFCSFLRETALLQSTFSLLGWDEQTGMPSGAADYRGEQMAYLAGIIHRRRTDNRLGEWLDELGDSSLCAEPHSVEGTIVRESKRQFERQSKLPDSLVMELTRTAVQGQHNWQHARKESDFSIFMPSLQKLIQLKQEEADAIGYTECRYDALLDEYEPWETTARVKNILEGLRGELIPLLQKIKNSPSTIETSCLHKYFSIEKQRQVGKEIAENIGFDFQQGRIDTTVHPFCTEIGPCDTRITTRYDDTFLPTSLFGILHEAGHAIYEQGLRKEWYGLPAGETISLGIHESQSRIWENQIGRSREFWMGYFPRLQNEFPDALQDISLDEFYKGINNVTPSPIRVEADEVTYNLHILIRFELEQLLLNDELHVADLPEAWNDKYEAYLDIRPENVAEGVLQDIHWSGGAFGYFPTYALGNLYSAQFFAKCASDIDDLHEQISNGQFSAFRHWLQENIHQHGQCYSAAELVLRVTGEPLTHRYLIEYLSEKADGIYVL